MMLTRMCFKSMIHKWPTCKVSTTLLSGAAAAAAAISAFSSRQPQPPHRSVCFRCVFLVQLQLVQLRTAQSYLIVFSRIFVNQCVPFRSLSSLTLVRFYLLNIQTIHTYKYICMYVYIFHIGLMLLRVCLVFYYYFYFYPLCVSVLSRMCPSGSTMACALWHVHSSGN